MRRSAHERPEQAAEIHCPRCDTQITVEFDMLHDPEYSDRPPQILVDHATCHCWGQREDKTILERLMKEQLS